MALSAKELHSGKGRHVMYSVTITTSNESIKCGTDCSVFLTIHGENGHTAVHSLRPLALVSSKQFSPGAIDKFVIQDIDVLPHSLPIYVSKFEICALSSFPEPPILQVGKIQRVTLTLSQDGSALDWKPCQVQLPPHLSFSHERAQ